MIWFAGATDVTPAGPLRAEDGWGTRRHVPADDCYEHYGALQSDQAIDYASQIIEFARHQMA